jgi:MoxR-like ATPase
LFERVGVLLRGDPELPRALLIDEIDKADIDLPNDLLNIFEEGQFEIQELSRLNEEEVAVRCYGSSAKVSLTRGRVRCHEFPFVVMTSNGERDFPAPFLRRCLRLDMPVPWIEPGRLEAIVYAHFEREQTFDKAQKAKAVALINGFLERAKGGTELLATDQLLNAIYLVTHAPALEGDEKIGWLPSSLRPLNAERL